MTVFGLDERVVRDAVARVMPDADAAGEASRGNSAIKNTAFGNASIGNASAQAGAAGHTAAGHTAAEAGAAEAGEADGDDGATAIAERFARGVFGMLAEPGDGDAGALVAALGAGAALSAVLARHDVPRIVAAAAERDVELAERLDASLPRALERWRPRINAESAIAAFEHAARVGARFLVPADAAWPAPLDDLGVHAPLGLWMRGRADALPRLARSVALVGARASTGYGNHVAAEAAAGMADRGVAVVSGAAYGIDGVAHEATLASGGVTAAFLAGGVDRFYPSGHHDLLTRIVDAGVVFSELPCGAAPTRWRFLQRNRLIAACGRATIVLEAGRRSGSLNTAGHAAALGRPLGAVPGPVTSPASAGCHRLIREYGAQLVTSPAEMLELVGGLDDDTLLAPFGEDATGTPSPGPSVEETRVLDALSTRVARDSTEVAARSGLSVGQVGAVLGVLSLEGRVVERPGGLWIRPAARRARS